jgi:hypothetical protein
MSKTLLVTRALGALGAVAVIALLGRLVRGGHTRWGAVGLGAAAVLVLALSAATVLFGMLLDLAHERAVDAAAWRSAGSEGGSTPRRRRRARRRNGRPGNADPAP